MPTCGAQQNDPSKGDNAMKKRLHKAIPVWLYWKLPLKAQIWLATYPNLFDPIDGRYNKWEHPGLFSTREDR